MTNIKKITALLLAVVMVAASFVVCWGDENDDEKIKNTAKSYIAAVEECNWEEAAKYLKNGTAEGCDLTEDTIKENVKNALISYGGEELQANTDDPETSDSIDKFVDLLVSGIDFEISEDSAVGKNNTLEYTISYYDTESLKGMVERLFNTSSNDNGGLDMISKLATLVEEIGNLEKVTETYELTFEKDEDSENWLIVSDKRK